MSLQPNLTSYIRNISAKNVRTFATAAAAKPKDQNESASFLPREEPKQINCNGVSVTSVETNRPVSRLAVYIKAGSRYEQPDKLGIVHALRIAAGATTKQATRFGIARTIDAHGGNLTCTVGREHIAYTLEATRDKIGNLSKYLKEVSLNQVFKPWEIEDNIPRLKYDLALRTPEVRVLEAIHKAAFRRGLGYGLYAPKYRAGSVTSGELQDYVKNNFVEASVVGVGLSQEDTANFASTLNISSRDRQLSPTKFGGGEYRKNKGGDLAYVAVVAEGSTLSDPKLSIASALAQRVLGSVSRAKRGVPAGKLSGLNGDSSSVNAISANYTDGGLFGVFIAATPKVAGDVTRKAVATLKGAKATDDDVSRAKSSLKSDIALNLESESALAEELGLRSLLTGRVNTLSETVQLIDAVTTADVNAVLAKGAGKLALAAYGNIANVPYLDEL
jgi:ubiquinol-cytochrome c reductase core subunit 2